MTRSLLLLTSILCTSAALAEPDARASEDAQTVSALVEARLLQPLRRREGKRSMFSRSAPVPVQRRVQVSADGPQIDAEGRRFVRFGIDERYSRDTQAPWRENRVVGCAYVGEGRVFIQRGTAFFPARLLLGKRVNPSKTACRAIRD